MTTSPRRSPATLLWLTLFLGFLFLLIGCVVTAAIFFWVRGGQLSARTQPISRSAPALAQTASSYQAAPAQPVVIATPAGGVDYETAVLMNIYEQVNPSVVNVVIFMTSRAVHGGSAFGTGNEDLLEVGGGSGFIWDSEGHIVTNFHVVENADEIHVRFSDGTVTLATVVGTDSDSDLAVLKVNTIGYQLRPVRRGNMDQVRVGMRVAAIGNPFGLAGTLTSGIVSAVGRSIRAHDNYSIPDSIQTDAPINPGNSGGPLINELGEVIGVNAQIRSEERANSGVGFAIPIAIVERVVPALISDGHYDHSFIGISGGPFNPICASELGLDPALRGAMVLDILSRTPAARAGLRAGFEPNDTRYDDICPKSKGGDLITAINGQSVEGFDDVLVYLERNASPGDEVMLTVLRDGQYQEMPLTLGKRPAND